MYTEAISVACVTNLDVFTKDICLHSYQCRLLEIPFSAQKLLKVSVDSAEL